MIQLHSVQAIIWAHIRGMITPQMSGHFAEPLVFGLLGCLNSFSFVHGLHQSDLVGLLFTFLNEYVKTLR